MINGIRLKELNEILSNQKNERPWVYPYDFQSYNERQVADIYGLDKDGFKRKLEPHKQVNSMAYGRVELETVDAMINFNALAPKAWQLKWARNL